MADKTKQQHLRDAVAHLEYAITAIDQTRDDDGCIARATRSIGEAVCCRRVDSDADVVSRPRTFKEALRDMPDVGADSDFER